MSDISLMSETYDDRAQRRIPEVPYPTAGGTQTSAITSRRRARKRRASKPGDFIGGSILKEIEESGFVKKLYGS